MMLLPPPMFLLMNLVTLFLNVDVSYLIDIVVSYVRKQLNIIAHNNLSILILSQHRPCIFNIVPILFTPSDPIYKRYLTQQKLMYMI